MMHNPERIYHTHKLTFDGPSTAVHTQHAVTKCVQSGIERESFTLCSFARQRNLGPLRMDRLMKDALGMFTCMRGRPRVGTESLL